MTYEETFPLHNGYAVSVPSAFTKKIAAAICVGPVSFSFSLTQKEAQLLLKTLSAALRESQGISE